MTRSSRQGQVRPWPTRNRRLSVPRPSGRRTLTSVEDVDTSRSTVRAGTDANRSRRRDDGIVGCTVLIVDDHAGFRSLARALLELAGYDVVGEAEDGASALVATRRLEPDVVLLDVALPDLDGFSVCEAILAEGVRPLIVMTSSREISSYRGRLETSGAAGFIAKRDLSGPALAALTR
jgi:CheY-like chemotaxis protein